MRTTLNIDDDLLKEAKIAAIRGNSTLTSFIAEAVREKLEKQSRWTAPVLSGGKLTLPAHIDPDDSQAVIDYLKFTGEDHYLQRALGPFPSRKGSPTREFDWNNTAALIEELEGLFARP